MRKLPGYLLTAGLSGVVEVVVWHHNNGNLTLLHPSHGRARTSSAMFATPCMRKPSIDAAGFLIISTIW